MRKFQIYIALTIFAFLISFFVPNQVCAQNYLLDVIADKNTPIPNGSGNFTEFGDPVSIDDGIAFWARGILDEGIYLYQDGILSVLADTNTTTPGGTATFSSFRDFPISSVGGDIVFRATEEGGNSGVYALINAVLTTIADENTPIPNGSDNFRTFNNFVTSFGEGTVAFVASGFSNQHGLYKFDNGTLSLIADRNTAVPMSIGTFGEFFLPTSIGQGNVAFFARDENDQLNGIYRFINDVLSKVVDTNTPIPGGIGNFTETSPFMALGNEDIVFEGSDGVDQFGLYGSIDGTLQVIADRNTPIPMSDDVFQIARAPLLLENGDFVFQGSGNVIFTAGIYKYSGGNLSVVLDNNTLKPFSEDNFIGGFPYEALGGEDFAFLGSGFQDDSIFTVKSNIIARVVDENDQIPLGQGTFDEISFGAHISEGNLAFRGVGAGGQEGIYKAIQKSVLRLKKVTIPQGGSGFEFLGTGFPASCNLNGVFSINDQEYIDCILDDGTYTVQETNTQGFEITDIDCSGTTSFSETVDSFTVDMLEGDIVECTFTNSDTIPPNLNSLDPGHAGVQNTLSANGAIPNGDVTFIYSLNLNGVAQPGISLNGEGPSARVAPDDICQGLETTLDNPSILANVQADGNGDASFTFPIPLEFVGLTVHVQAVDITTCTGSNVNTETIENPPGPEVMLLPLDPSQAGVQNTLSATNASPNNDVKFIWGFNQGNQTADNICPGFQSGILNPNTLVTVQSDGSGNADFSFFIPIGFAGATVHLQAVDMNTCTGSNVNQETIQ